MSIHELEFVPAVGSAHADVLSRRNESDKVVAKLDDIEIVFFALSNSRRSSEKMET